MGTSFMGSNGSALSKTNTTPHMIDQDFSADSSTVQIVGILRGDVDGSWAAQ